MGTMTHTGCPLRLLLLLLLLLMLVPTPPFVTGMSARLLLLSSMLFPPYLITQHRCIARMHTTAALWHVCVCVCVCVRACVCARR